MSANNWVSFLFGWDPEITKFFIASKLEDYYKADGKPFCVTFHSVLNRALPTSALFVGKSTSVTLTGQQILQILQYLPSEAETQALNALNVQNNLALYEAIIYLRTAGSLISQIQAGLLAHEFRLQNKVYAKSFVIPDLIWNTGNSIGWLNELGVTSQSVYLYRDQILQFFYRDGTGPVF